MTFDYRLIYISGMSFKQGKHRTNKNKTMTGKKKQCVS